MDKEKELFENTTCFEAHSKKNKACLNKKCRYWHSLENEKSNCKEIYEGKFIDLKKCL